MSPDKVTKLLWTLTIVLGCYACMTKMYVDCTGVEHNLLLVLVMHMSTLLLRSRVKAAEVYCSAQLGAVHICCSNAAAVTAKKSRCALQAQAADCGVDACVSLMIE